IHRSLRGPRILPGYRALEPVGRGSFGEVWLAEDSLSGKRVAIKFFAHGTSRRWEGLLGEVRQLALLHGDPGIVPFYDVVHEAEPPYYVMKFAENGSVARRIEQKGPLPLAEVMRIFRAVTPALAYLPATAIR